MGGEQSQEIKGVSCPDSEAHRRGQGEITKSLALLDQQVCPW